MRRGVPTLSLIHFQFWHFQFWNLSLNQPIAYSDA